MVQHAQFDLWWSLSEVQLHLSMGWKCPICNVPILYTVALLAFQVQPMVQKWRSLSPSRFRRIFINDQVVAYGLQMKDFRNFTWDDTRAAGQARENFLFRSRQSLHWQWQSNIWTSPREIASHICYSVYSNSYIMIVELRTLYKGVVPLLVIVLMTPGPWSTPNVSFVMYSG